MIRLYILVEGKTEREFVSRVLTPHLQTHGVHAIAVVVTTRREHSGQKSGRGGGRWSQWRRDLTRLSAEQRGADVRFTTLFDLYGLPDDFPGLSACGTDQDTLRRAAALEAAMGEAIGDRRLIPYLQRHEFEALVLAGIDQFVRLLDTEDDAAAVRHLREDIAGLAPEDVNDGRETAPSKRLAAHLPRYRKAFHGPLVVEATGIDALRIACPRFGAWLTRLEALGGSCEGATP